SQSLADALRAIGRRTSLNILFDPEVVRNLSAGSLHGTFTATQAIDHALRGTHLIETRADVHSVLVRLALVERSSDLPVAADPARGGDPPLAVGSAVPLAPP